MPDAAASNPAVPTPLLYTVVAAMFLGALLAAQEQAATEQVLSWTLLVSAPVLLALVVVDLREHRLPNVLNCALAGIACLGAVANALVQSDVGFLQRAVVGAVGMGLVYAALALIGHGQGMGLGDVKLAPSVGALAGWEGLETFLEAFALAFLAGGLVASALILSGRGRKARIPFGPFMIGGLLLALN